MFWIHGGALQFGNAGQNAYDGSSFATYQNVIVVTINYRLNGKFSCPTIRRTRPIHRSVPYQTH